MSDSVSSSSDMSVSRAYKETHADDTTFECSPKSASGMPCFRSLNSGFSETLSSSHSVPIPCFGAEVHEALEDHALDMLLQDVGTDVHGRKWIDQVRAKFKGDPYYYAMLKYEPKALKAIIMSTMDWPCRNEATATN